LFSGTLLMQISSVLQAHSSAIRICSAFGNGELAFNRRCSSSQSRIS
jgi:hypothetical protein